MKIRDRFYFWIAVLLCIPLALLVIERWRFIAVSEETIGTVEAVTAYNSGCGKHRRKDCTKFVASIRYEVGEVGYSITVTAGKAYELDQPVSLADCSVGQRMPVLYDPRRPSRALRNGFWEIWGGSVGLFFVQICAFIGGLREKPRRTR